MAVLTANIPFQRVLVRREYTTGYKRHHGEYLQGFVHAVTSYMGRQLSFQVCFTEPGYGGYSWSRMPLRAIVTQECEDDWSDFAIQPWDCGSFEFSVVRFEMFQDLPMFALINGEKHEGRYWFSVDYFNSMYADDHRQNKITHLCKLDCGRIVGVPNNRSQFYDPAFFELGGDRPDFEPMHRGFSSESESFIEMTDAYDNFHGGYDVVEEEHDCDETCELCPHGNCPDCEYCDASEEEE